MVNKSLLIPIELLLDKRLDAANKIIMAQIISLQTAPDGCHISDKSLGQITCLSRTAVNKRISHLSNFGFISTVTICDNGKVIGRKILVCENSSPAIHVENNSTKRKNTTKKKKTDKEIIEEIINNNRKTSVYSGHTISSNLSDFSKSNNTLNIIENNTYNTEYSVPQVNTKVNTGISNYEWNKNRLEEIVEDIYNVCDIGDTLFEYFTPINVEDLKYIIPVEIFVSIRPKFEEYFRIQTLLYGKN